MMGPFSYFQLLLSHFVTKKLVFSLKAALGRVNIFYSNIKHGGKQRDKLLDSKVSQRSSDLKSEKKKRVTIPSEKKLC